MNRKLRIAAAAAVAGGALVGASTAAAQNATGAGASFPSKAYQYWCATYGGCSYNSVGSTAGIRSLIGKTVDFSASDAELTADQLAQAGGSVTYIPTLIGAIAIPVNIPGVTGNKLKITGDTLGQIFAGDIKDWAALAATSPFKADNKGVKLPAAPITLCVRSDGSGTSFAFSRYLTKVSPSFKTKVNFSQSPPWAPGGTVVKSPQNVGVANCVKSNANSIGYVDLGDTINAGLVTNAASIGLPKSGPYTLPSVKTMTDAGKTQKVWNPRLLQDFSAAPSPNAKQKKAGVGQPYPIVATTWLLFRPGGKNNLLAKTIASKFLSKQYQADLPKLGFAPLPGEMLKRSGAALATVPN